MTWILDAALAALALFLWRRSAQLERSLFELHRVAARLADGDYASRSAQRPGRPLNRLAERIQGAFAQLARDKVELETILANIVEAVAAVDHEGRVIAVNPALCSLLGVAKDAAIDASFIEVLRHARLNELLSAVIREKKGRVEEVSIFAPEERQFEAHAVPLNLGALLVLHDITKLRSLERMRREFVANVSHELRTPLASIRAFAETLREGALEDPEHRLEFVLDIEKDAERLTALVDDLLDLSAIESGHRAPVKEPLSLMEAAREAADALKPLAERRKVEIAIKDFPGHHRADRSQLKQVLTNLIGNAIKYNKEGGAVEVFAEAQGSFVKVFVRDTGPGIPTADLPRIFERFYRVDKARSREQGGTGLGLSIVKHIVESHGGAVGVDSVLDGGSTFFFTLPQ